MITKKNLDKILWDWRKAILIMEAVKLQIFDHLLVKKSISYEKIAENLKLDKDKTYLLMLALAGLKLILKNGNKFSNTETADRYLKSTSKDFLGGTVDLNHRAVLNWMKISDVTKSGIPISPPEQTQVEKSKWKGRFLAAMDELSREKVNKVVKLIPVKNNSTLLDIGAGPCSYLIKIVNSHKNVKGFAFDLEDAKETINKILKQSKTEKKISFIAGDMNSYQFPENSYDTVILSQVLHIIGKEKANNLIARIEKSLKPGGNIAIQEMVTEETNISEAAIFAVQMLIGTKTGYFFSSNEIKDLGKNNNMKFVSARRTDEKSKLFVFAKK